MGNFSKLMEASLPDTRFSPSKPGAYRIFIQMKHGSTVETGVFDANVR